MRWQQQQQLQLQQQQLLQHARRFTGDEQQLLLPKNRCID
ncbi:hypothetical protein ENH_00067920 [Eimeria necatrix]|uniref:Uncharacterized protein n=1 Tax=Eimeria necatrix TaxID=51315 RepID=U6MPF5_9EIME|nr:hypothetical protein ENH_00067920 [Eimeria necatrix]CDJ64369.1 hypothetical protein ENH_00067920 [Eimeria necatrix]